MGVFLCWQNAVVPGHFLNLKFLFATSNDIKYLCNDNVTKTDIFLRQDWPNAFYWHCGSHCGNCPCIVSFELQHFRPSLTHICSMNLRVEFRHFVSEKSHLFATASSTTNIYCKYGSGLLVLLRFLYDKCVSVSSVLMLPHLFFFVLFEFKRQRLHLDFFEIIASSVRVSVFTSKHNVYCCFVIWAYRCVYFISMGKPVRNAHTLSLKQQQNNSVRWTHKCPSKFRNHFSWACDKRATIHTDICSAFGFRWMYICLYWFKPH